MTQDFSESCSKNEADWKHNFEIFPLLGGHSLNITQPKGNVCSATV